MPKQDPLIQFKNKVRVRVCGILEHKECILMIRHSGLVEKDVWLAPGGGVQFGETIEEALIREFKEETNLDIQVSDFLGINEHIKNDLHAIEIYHKVVYKKGTINLGSDPELEPHNQILKDIKYLKKEHAIQYIPSLQ